MPTGTSGSVLVVIVGPPVPCRDYDRRYHLRPGTVIQAYRKLTMHPQMKTLSRVRRENIFGKASRSRVEDILGIFRQRYLSEQSVTKALVTLVRGKFPSAALD